MDPVVDCEYFAPLLTGYVAACVSVARPQLHAVFAGLIAWMFATWLGGGLFAGLLGLSMAGAAIHAKRRV